MSKLLRFFLLLNAIISFLIGAPLLLAPGRTLGFFSWIYVDPLLTRLLGAALLALAWASFAAWLKNERTLAKTVVQTEFIFNALGTLGFLRHFLTGVQYQPVIWVLLGLLLTGTIIWGFFLLRLR